MCRLPPRQTRIRVLPIRGSSNTCFDPTGTFTVIMIPSHQAGVGTALMELWTCLSARSMCEDRGRRWASRCKGDWSTQKGDRSDKHGAAKRDSKTRAWPQRKKKRPPGANCGLCTELRRTGSTRYDDAHKIGTSRKKMQSALRRARSAMSGSGLREDKAHVAAANTERPPKCGGLWGGMRDTPVCARSESTIRFHLAKEPGRRGPRNDG